MEDRKETQRHCLQVAENVYKTWTYISAELRCQRGDFILSTFQFSA